MAKEKIKYQHLTARTEMFNRFSIYCDMVKRSKLDQLEIILTEFLKDKAIPEK